jgi:two-component system, NarL family, response regulator LiaR
MSDNPIAHFHDLPIAIVENESIALTGLRYHLEQLGCHIVWTARDDEEARQKSADELPNILFVDLKLQHSADYQPGWQLIKELRERGKGQAVAIIIFSSAPVVDEIVLEAVRFGCSYVVKQDLWEKEQEILTGALLAAQSGSVFLSREVTGVLEMVATQAQTADLLSPKELEVLALVADGLTNQDIANKQFLSIATIKTHVSRILSKLEVDNRVQASEWYRQHYG